MNAKEMRKIAKQVKQKQEAKEKRNKHKAAKDLEIWWRSEYKEVTDNIEGAASKGSCSYTKTYEIDCPPFIPLALKALGFEASIKPIHLGMGRFNYTLEVSWR